MSGPSTEELDQLYREYTLRRQANGYRTHVDYWTWLSSRQRPGARERRVRRAEREAREAAAAERVRPPPPLPERGGAPRSGHSSGANRQPDSQ